MADGIEIYVRPSGGRIYYTSMSPLPCASNSFRISRMGGSMRKEWTFT